MGERLFTRDFALLFGAHFVQAFGYASLLLFPIYLDHLGANRTEIGTIMAVAAIGSLAVRPLTGWALDTIGRKPVLIVGTLLLMLSLALIALVDHAGGMAYVCRLLFGFAAGALFPGYFTLAADIIPEGRRTEGLAIFGLGGLIPLAFNPMVERLGIEPGQLVLFFPMVGAFILLSLVMLFPVTEPERPKVKEGRSLMEVLEKLVAKPLWPVWFASIVFSALVSVFMTFATVCAKSRMVDDPADLWFTYAAGAALVRILGARLPDRVGTRNMVAPSMGFYIVGLIVTAQAQSAEAFLWGGFLAGLGHGYCFPVLTSQVVDRVDRTLTGSGMAVFTALWEVVSLVITPLFGMLADTSGDGIMFFTAAIIAIGSLFLWALAERRWGEPP